MRLLLGITLRICGYPQVWIEVWSCSCLENTCSSLVSKDELTSGFSITSITPALNASCRIFGFAVLVRRITGSMESCWRSSRSKDRPLELAECVSTNKQPASDSLGVYASRNCLASVKKRTRMSYVPRSARSASPIATSGSMTYTIFFFCKRIHHGLFGIYAAV